MGGREGGGAWEGGREGRKEGGREGEMDGGRVDWFMSGSTGDEESS